MIQLNREFYSSPYYFLIQDKGEKYSLSFSVEKTLSEAKKKKDEVYFDKKKGGEVKKYISKITKEKKIKDNKKIKKDLEELVDMDGGMSNSKIPILDPRLHPRKTMDQTVAAASITNDPISRGYRTYYGESVEEVSEEDLSGTFGGEETKDMDGEETYKYFKNELEMDDEEAKDRTAEQGKDWTGGMDRKSELYGDPDFITRATLSEIQKNKVIKMVEDILTKKKEQDKGELNQKKHDISPLLKKNLESLRKRANKEGLSISDLIKIMKSE